MSTPRALPALALLSLSVAACAETGAAPPGTGAPVEAALPAPEAVATASLDPTPAPPPPVGASTLEELDTTTEEDRAAALAPPSEPEAEGFLGTTVASLGAPTDPGIWLSTPLVTEPTMGRVEYAGASVNLELRPSGGEPGSGSEISLAALRLLGASPTALPELSVYGG